jgi:hypothetical protein
LELKGGYYPLVRDFNDSPNVKYNEKGQEQALFENQTLFGAATDKGHTQARNRGAIYNISVQLGNFEYELKKQIHDLAFREVIYNTNRITKNKDFQEAVKDVYGVQTLSNFKLLIKNIAGGDVKNITEKWLAMLIKLRNNFGLSVLAFKIGVILENFSNMPLYNNERLGFTKLDVWKGVKEASFGGYFQYRDEIKELSPYMKQREKENNITFKSIKDSKNRIKSKIDKTSEAGMFLLSLTDNMSAFCMWKVMYDKQLALTGNKNKAVLLADTLIEETIGSGNNYFTSTFFQKGQAKELFTAFGSFFNKQFNRFYVEVNSAIENKDYEAFASYCLNTFIAITTGFYIKYLLKNLFADNDDDAADILKKLINDNIRYMTGGIPIGRDIVSYILSQNQYKSLNLMSIESPLREIAKIPMDIWDGEFGNAFLSALKSVAYSTGTPSLFVDVAANLYEDLNYEKDFQISDFWQRN